MNSKFIWYGLVPTALVAGGVALQGCKGVSASASETNYSSGQLMGDMMDGVDEGIIGPARRAAELRGHRSSCLSGGAPLSSCVNNVRTRTFGGCTIGAVTFNGTVAFTWSDAAVDNTCSVTAQGHSIARKPNWNMTGALGWTFYAETSGTEGQKVIRGANNNTFTFTNDGIRRYATNADGIVVTDFTTRTTSPIQVSAPNGALVRNGRTVDGGGLEITNNKTGVTCTLVPEMLTWGANCNCATSGTVGGTCSDGSSFTFDIKSCGNADVTYGGTTTSVNLNRCSSI